MLGFLELVTNLSKQASDNEAALALKEYLTKFGTITNACRFTALENVKDKRHFLIKFKNPSDALNAISQLKLRSFAFDSVLIELEQKQ